MGDRRVVITGMGIICPLGNDVESTWEGLVKGKNGVGPITRFDASSLKSQFAAEVKDFDPVSLFGPRESRRMDRVTQFAMAAATEAIKDSGLDLSTVNRDRIGVVLGSGIGGLESLVEQAYQAHEKGEEWVSPHMVPMMLPDTSPGKIAIEMGLRGPNMNIATACASGNNAIGESAAMVRRGAADVMVTGGTEAGIVKLSIAGFANMGALSQRNYDPLHASRPFDKDRDGFVAGEGAGILILESEEHALNRGAHIYGEMMGYAATEDAYHVTAPPEDGNGAAAAMKAALQDAGISPKSIDYLNAHGTSTPLNDKSETRAIKTVFGEAAYDLPISSTKSMTGHMFGAAGAVEAIFSIKTIETGWIPPTINYEIPDPECDLDYVPNEARQKEVNLVLSNSFGFGGHNACLVLGRYDNGRTTG
jgi:3-oxoacyl-[acyl-carrier-protein] synthase II